MSVKISNDILRKAIQFNEKDISSSIKDFAESADLKASTLSAWHRKLKKGEWPPNYSKTADGEPLEPELVEKFVNAFSFSGSSSRILKRLVTAKCLNNKYCFAKQHKILKRMFKKYPNVHFWLKADFGEPRDDILLFLGKAESGLKKKYIDFKAKDTYTSFNYTYEPTESTNPKPKKKRSFWDYYE